MKELQLSLVDIGAQFNSVQIYNKVNIRLKAFSIPTFVDRNKLVNFSIISKLRNNYTILDNEI